MATNDARVEIKAFKNEEEYNNFINISNKIDAFCTQAKILETVAKSNKYVEASMDLCGKNGDVQEVVKIFSPVIDTSIDSERELFASIGSKVVRLGTETAFEAGGAKLGHSIGTLIVGAGGGTPPAWIMGVATGGSFYLGGKYIGIGVGHYTEKASYNEFLEFYDKYLKEKTRVDDSIDDTIDTENNKKELEFIDTNNNEKTIFKENKETKKQEPITKIDLSDNSSIPLNPDYRAEDLAFNQASQEKILDEKINTFQNFTKVFMQDTELKEDIEKLQKQIEEIDSKTNLDEKIKSLESVDFKSFTSNTYIDQVFSNYRDNIIKDSTTSQENTNTNTEYKNYDYMQTNTNTNQNSNSSVQMMN